MRILSGILLAGLIAAPAAAADSSDCIAMIGTGSVGGALGPGLAGKGERIIYGSRTPDAERVQALVRRTAADASALTPAAAASACDTIVLAVPWEAVEPTLRSLGKLDGKLMIDVTNPLTVREGRVVALPVQDSGAEYVQSLAGGATVVKAFNTINFRVMADPAIAGGPVSVPISGDDAGARARVARLAAAIGLEPIDVGALRTARYTEAMALLYVTRLVSGQPPFEFYLRPRPVP